MKKKESSNFPKPINTTNPTDWIPYKNRWGHWVWRREDINEDKTWPPNDTVIPKVINGKWQWVEQ